MIVLLTFEENCNISNISSPDIFDNQPVRDNIPSIKIKQAYALWLHLISAIITPYSNICIFCYFLFFSHHFDFIESAVPIIFAFWAFWGSTNGSNFFSLQLEYFVKGTEDVWTLLLLVLITRKLNVWPT